ncbi:bacitracin ABC transporter permease protein [Flammeovirgaceae bacterium 311]|nr:bacitracin ABC transporter permease protein [Flammeovirgaceae bacterium 311]
MEAQIGALKAELLKNRYSHILWVTFVAFGLAPLMGGVFMLIMRNPDAIAKASALNTKAQMIGFTADWNSYFGILSQALGVGGVLVFGFVASWIFGREYSEGTTKDLLALPTSRTRIIHAKFMVYAAWCFALVLSNLLIGFAIGSLLQLTATDYGAVAAHLKDYFTTAALTLLLGTPIAFFAIWGKGYLAPLGFVALALVLSQIVAATGYGYYFPWSVPGLFSGAGGEYKDQLDVLSYAILLLTAIAGYFATIAYWKYADHTK